MSRSKVNAETPVVEGRHCRDIFRGLREYVPGRDYGVLWDGARRAYMHRLAYEVWVGPIPSGMDVLHRCDRPRCIEPRHLWCGTHQENLADMVRKGRHLPGRDRGAAKRRGRPAPWTHGQNHPRSRLRNEEALEIKRRLRTLVLGERGGGMRALAREFNVSESLIKNIRDGRGWAWLDVDADLPALETAAARARAAAKPEGFKEPKYQLDDPRRPRVAGLKLRDALRG